MQASYIAFLAVLSYFVLTELQPFTSLADITVCEWIIGVWFISHVVEELIQVTDALLPVVLVGFSRHVHPFVTRFVSHTSVCLSVPSVHI